MILTWIPSIWSSSDGGAVELDPTERDGFFLAASEDEDFVEFGTFSRLSFKSTIQIKIGKNVSEWKAFREKNLKFFENENLWDFIIWNYDWHRREKNSIWKETLEDF